MKLKINESYKEGLVAIWWYTNGGEFWDYCKTLDDAYNDGYFLQYSGTQNHLTLWRTAVKDHIPNDEEQKEVISKGYKSIERGRIVYNLRAQCYEITCSDELVKDENFRKNCVDYFNLKGNRYSFVPMQHYAKQELTGNPSIDSMYYET